MLRSMMYVTTASGCLRHLTLSASAPSSSRSASRRSATPSSRDRRRPSSTFLRVSSSLAMEPQLRQLRNERQRVGAPQELAQPLLLALAERVDDVLAQVALVFRRARRVAARLMGRDRGERL